MKHHIRKIEIFKVYRTTRVVELDDEDFRNLEECPFTGSTREEFLDYLSKINFSDTPYDLDDENSSKLSTLRESAWTEYMNTYTSGGADVWLQIGEPDESYTENGGFRTDGEAQSEY